MSNSKNIFKSALILGMLFNCFSLTAQMNAFYRSDSVVFSKIGDTLHFGATLTIPIATKIKDAAIIISGTGRQDRDGKMAGHKMFEVIADSLSRNGIAVLRIDDRQTGLTNGIYDSATIYDFASDVTIAINYLKKRPELKDVKIGLIGHSEGGAVATIVAAQNKDVKFVVSLSGPGIKGLDALILQNKQIVHNAPIPDINKLRFDSVNNLLFHIVYNNANSPELEAKMRAAYAAWNVWSDSIVKANHLKFGGHFFFPFESYLSQAKGKWYRSFITYNPETYLTKIKIPFLAINGKRDLISSYKENLAGFENGLKKANNKHFSIWAIPNLNHLYQKCKVCDFAEYSKLNSAFDPDLLHRIVGWIRENG